MLPGVPVCEPIWLLVIPSSVPPGGPVCELIWLPMVFLYWSFAARRTVLLGAGGSVYMQAYMVLSSTTSAALTGRFLYATVVRLKKLEKPYAAISWKKSNVAMETCLVTRLVIVTPASIVI